MCLCNCPSGTNKLNGISWVRVPGAKPCEEKKKAWWWIPSGQSVTLCSFPFGNIWKVLLTFKRPGISQLGSQLAGQLYLQIQECDAQPVPPYPKDLIRKRITLVCFMFFGKGCRKQMKHVASEYFSGIFCAHNSATVHVCSLILIMFGENVTDQDYISMMIVLVAANWLYIHGICKSGGGGKRSCTCVHVKSPPALPSDISHKWIFSLTSHTSGRAYPVLPLSVWVSSREPRLPPTVLRHPSWVNCWF